MSETTPSADELKELFIGKSDDEILAQTHGNEEPLLDGVFEGMRAAFNPAAASGASAVIQYDIDGPDGAMSYHLSVAAGVCTLARGAAGDPQVRLGLSLPAFVRMMVTEELNGMQAYVTGRLKISGDMALAQRVAVWFSP